MFDAKVAKNALPSIRIFLKLFRVKVEDLIQRDRSHTPRINTDMNLTRSRSSNLGVCMSMQEEGILSESCRIWSELSIPILMNMMSISHDSRKVTHQNVRYVLSRRKEILIEIMLKDKVIEIQVVFIYTEKPCVQVHLCLIELSVMIP